jgi:hypothetical protein
MPSPFPGMNPYFEQAAHWQDFHTEFLSAFRRQLAPRIAPNYIVQLEEHVFIHDLPPEPRRSLGRADLSVTQVEALSASQPARGCWRPQRRSTSRLKIWNGSRSWRSGTAVDGSS